MAKNNKTSAAAKEFQAARDHCEKMGIDPDSVSNAVRMLSLKFDRGPLELLWHAAVDPKTSPSARVAATQAILPYLQGKPAPATKPLATGLVPGVMELPIAESMQQWMGIAAASQAELKQVVKT